MLAPRRSNAERIHSAFRRMLARSVATLGIARSSRNSARISAARAARHTRAAATASLWAKAGPAARDETMATKASRNMGGSCLESAARDKPCPGRFDRRPPCNHPSSGGDSSDEGRTRSGRLRLTSDETTRRARPDLAVFEGIYREHHRRVWALASRWERDPQRAEELLQEVFVRVWRALPDFRGESTLATWIHAIALRTALDRARSDRRREERERAAVETEPSKVEPRPGEAIDLERAIAALPDGQRRMFILHAIEGYRCREIADRMGVAVGTVQSQIFRAREKLKEVLER